jgi:AraC family transcriptional activator of mtrCDE
MSSNPIHVTNQPLARMARADLDSLMTSLEISFVYLAECVIGRGWRLELSGPDAPGIHYNLRGTGQLLIAGQSPIPLQPHTLVVVPRGTRCALEVPGSGDDLEVIKSRLQSAPDGVVPRHVANDGEAELILVCGYFKAAYGATIDLFPSLVAPIVEQFDATDQLDHKLRAALDELVAQEVGAGAMATALLKQVLVALLRRSLSSINTWVERFTVLGDPQIARAFAEMTARPAAPHRVETLARTAGLSRSAFMARFGASFTKSPMAVLRDLRMRQAALLLTTSRFTLDQVAARVGYTSRSSFVRAFRTVYGCNPSDYKATAAEIGTITPL